jgi:hypothetical protein
MDNLLSSLNTFVSRSETAADLVDSVKLAILPETEESNSDFVYPAYSESEQDTINMINGYIGVNCCMGKMNIGDDGSFQTVACTTDVPTDYDNTLAAQQSSTSSTLSTIETFSNYRKFNKLNVYFIIILTALFILFAL